MECRVRDVEDDEAKWEYSFCPRGMKEMSLNEVEVFSCITRPDQLMQCRFYRVISCLVSPKLSRLRFAWQTMDTR